MGAAMTGSSRWPSAPTMTIGIRVAVRPAISIEATRPPGLSRLAAVAIRMLRERVGHRDRRRARDLAGREVEGRRDTFAASSSASSLIRS